jgi:hypothetical protein
MRLLVLEGLVWKDDLLQYIIFYCLSGDLSVVVTHVCRKKSPCSAEGEEKAR